MSRTGDSGFTLLEMTVVLALAGLVLTVMPVKFERASDRARLSDDASRLAATLDWARSAAILRSDEVDMAFDLERRLYAVDARVDHFDPRATVTLFAADRDLAGPRQGMIRFFPDGSSSGGQVRIRNDAGTMVVDIDWLTGRISARAG